MNEGSRELHPESINLHDSNFDEVLQEMRAQGYIFDIKEDSSEFLITFEKDDKVVHITKVSESPETVAGYIRKAIERHADKK